MSALELRYPVFTLDRQILFPAGTDLSEVAMQELLRSRGQAPAQEKYSLLRYGSVEKDIRAFLVDPPYGTIFSGAEYIDLVLSMMEMVRFIPPVFESLDYFRQHDFHTYRHILMVFALSTLLAEDLLPDAESRILLAETGPTHDIGKICVPLPVLKKTSPLTRKEKTAVEHHALAGFVLLCFYGTDDRNIAATVARDHHERKNASGYPRAIRLADPLVEIIAACDVYDALISPRPYRSATYDNRTALEEITEMAERGEIGWDVVKALVAYNRREKHHFSEQKVSEEKRGTPPPGNVHGLVADEE